MSEHAQQMHSIEPVSDSRLVIRKARLADVGDMYRIVNHYAETQLMLPKTELQLYEHLRDYSVALDPDSPDRLIGCGALHIYWENLAEIRALAIAPGMARRGIGTALVNSLLVEARDMGIEQIFLFTYEPKFFSRFGFTQVEHNTLPLKVYNECFNCPKFNTCDELAMVLHL
jgi:amino-acid N-acetyltransferase